MRQPSRGLEELKELCWKEYPAVRRYCERVLLDDQDAQDACQVTFLRAMRAQEKLQTHECPGGWLMETAKRVCKESLRRRRREAGRVGDGKLFAEHVAERQREGTGKTVPGHIAYTRLAHQRHADSADRRRKLESLAELVEQLRPGFREVAQLTLRGFYPEEIAAQLGITENAVNIRLHKAREALRELEQWRRERGEGGM